jgi:dipeptidyl aminopeptidase/acylaminoacyl peptidase
VHIKTKLPIAPFISGTSVGNPQFSPDGKYVAYLRSSDNGKDLVIYNRDQGSGRDLLSYHKISTGTAYGGEEFCWSKDSQSIVFSSSGSLFEIEIGGSEPREIVSLDKSFHPQIDDIGLYFVIEHKTRMSLATSSMNSDGYGWPTQILTNYSFIYDPARHPDGTIIAHAWDFPHMSWDGSKLVRIDSDGSITELTDGSDWIAQPRYSPDYKHLAFLNEESGWINLWVADASGENRRILVAESHEHSYSTWVTGMRNYAWLSNERIVFTRNTDGTIELVVSDLSGTTTVLDLPGGVYEKLHSDGAGWITFQYSSYRDPYRIQMIRIGDDNQILDNKTIEQSGVIIDSFAEDFIAPDVYHFPTRDGNEAHALVYSDPSFDSQDRPLLISVHGGPTGMSTNKFNFQPQYFAKQGWIVALINYRGSIGYGRDYRNILRGRWGDYDVWDCLDLKADMVKNQGVNASKVAIMGGSAGGYTTLYALAKYPGEFAAGVNLFGVADLFLLAEETHYLESHYLDMIIGKLPEDAKNYYTRSPINFADNITDPLLTLQGEDDPVVPKNQSELIHESAKGVKEMKIYPNEGHGFRLLKTLEDMYPRIDRFLQKHVVYRVVE